jgi:hypothetical protein
MPETEQTVERPDHFSIGDLPHRKAEDFRTVYTNTAGVGAGFYDIQIIFGHVVPEHSKDESFHPHIDDTVAVIMSWEHAKALVAGLTKAIDNYEKEHGPLRVAEGPKA